ncbi:MAG: PorT family protein [Cyclobacteriaceae bacterium]|nr:PorT family protein [Cyclobacteriaceae bacterium]
MNKNFHIRPGEINVILIFLCLFPGIGPFAFAQEFSAGFNAGGGISTVTYSREEFRDQYNPGLKPAFKGGLSLNLPLTKTFHLYSEYNYAMRGRKVQALENEWTLNEIHQYIEIPVLLNIRKTGEIKKIGPVEQIGPFTWTLGVGPNISYLLGGSGTLETFALETDYKISFGGHESDFNYITFNPVKRWQWGLDIHLGLISPLVNGKELFTSLKFTYGHTNLGTYDGSNMPILGFTDNLAHNYKILTLSFAYLFHLDLRELYRGKSTKGKKVKAKRIDSSPAKKGNNINKIK